MYYDAREGIYHYAFPNGAGFCTTEPVGSIVNKAVTVSAENGAFIGGYSMDNIAAETPKEKGSSGRITEFTADRAGGYGFYAEITTNNGTQWDIYSTRMSFQVVGEDMPVQLSLLRAPCGYEIGSVLLDGISIPLKTKEFFLPEKDGGYSVTFMPSEMAGAGEYTVYFERDTTAPRLVFSQDISDHEAEGTLYFHPEEPDTVTEVYLNGGLIRDTVEGVAAGGNYRIVATDTYGNSRDYYFSLHSKGSASPALYIGTFLVLLLISALVILISRKNMRVL